MCQKRHSVESNDVLRYEHTHNCGKTRKVSPFIFPPYDTHSSCITDLKQSALACRCHKVMIRLYPKHKLHFYKYELTYLSIR